MEREQILEFLRVNNQYIRTHYHITKLGLIGSYARGDNKENSDIDLLIEFESGLVNIHDLKNALRAYLKLHLKTDIDLCREKYIKPHFKQYILNDVIYIQ